MKKLIYLRRTNIVHPAYDAVVIFAGLIDAIVPLVTLSLVGTRFQDALVRRALDKHAEKLEAQREAEHQERMRKDPEYRKQVQETMQMMRDIERALHAEVKRHDPDATVETHHIH